jgi:hypothetical protein
MFLNGTKSQYRGFFSSVGISSIWLWPISCPGTDAHADSCAYTCSNPDAYFNCDRPSENDALSDTNALSDIYAFSDSYSHAY